MLIGQGETPIKPPPRPYASWRVGVTPVAQNTSLAQVARHEQAVEATRTGLDLFGWSSSAIAPSVSRPTVGRLSAKCGNRRYAARMDLGEPCSYLALKHNTPVYSSDGVEIGKVSHVLAAEDEDVFDGIVIGEHIFGEEHRFADADDVQEIFEHGVVLKLDRAACEQLPKPSANPGVLRDDPAESSSEFGHQKLKRAWDLISGK